MNNSINSGLDAYGSWTRTVTLGGLSDFFTNGTVVEKVPPVGVNYTNSNGRFEVEQDGIYSIELCLYVQGSGAGTLVLDVNGVNEYRADTYVHAAVDPVERSVHIIKSLTKDDYINVGSTVAVTVTLGTTFTIKRIA